MDELDSWVVVYASGRRRQCRDLALVLDAVIPPGSIPFTVSTSRLVTSVGLLLVASVAGCAFSLRRVLRVDPASAIGTAS